MKSCSIIKLDLQNLESIKCFKSNLKEIFSAKT